jgi:hypothetical protein
MDFLIIAREGIARRILTEGLADGDADFTVFDPSFVRNSRICAHFTPDLRPAQHLRGFCLIRSHRSCMK